MPLVPETGKKEEGANCYADVNTVNKWQAMRGSEKWLTPPEGEEDPNLAAKEAAIVLAADFLNGLRWKGRRVEGGRIMAWPRIEVVDGDGYPVADDVVPSQVVAANCYLAGLVYDDVDLQPILERGGRIQSEGVGSMRTSFFEDARDRNVFTVLSDLLYGLAIGLGGEQGKAPGGTSVFQVVRA